MKVILNTYYLKNSTNNLFWLIDKGYINIVREIAIKVRNKIFWREGYIAIKRRLLYKKKYSSADIDTMEEIEKLLMPQNVEEEILIGACLAHLM